VLCAQEPVAEGDEHAHHASPARKGQHDDVHAEHGTTRKPPEASAHDMRHSGNATENGKGNAPADARDPDYSEGVDGGDMSGMHEGHRMHGDSRIGHIVVDHLEWVGGDERGQAIDAAASYGSDINKLWFEIDAERSGGHLESARSELHWDKAITPFWNLQTGLRHDFGHGSGRNWAAIGFRGLAPYWLEVGATAYVGESGRTAIRLETEYDLLLTQRLILQPDIEVNIHGKDDPARDVGAGFSDLDIGLRLRYEITRKFAPYAGVVWSRKFGKTADFARAANGDLEDTQFVAGVRLWF
jgi:copper resistance protein B